MKNQEEILSYYGYFSYEVTGKLIEDLKVKKDQLDLQKNVFRKILTLMVEILENNYKYVSSLQSHTLAKTSRKPLFRIKMNENHFSIISGNPILEHDVKALKRKIDLINSLEHNELKELYKITMSEGIYDNKQGAGLGMMKMAKISKNKIHYTIENLKDELYYYTIEVRIPTQ